ncbi:LamG-like jellyroll fold domain-containing protein [Geofilum sp. OHC36d9]|uniref:LamG-like jellyroll fold domain-containing protein n=1 Tax=Geofilum sp. OHC36d9 TaxID=3458413 RepID=UPI0040342C27
MKTRNLLLKKWYFITLLCLLGISTANAQVVDTCNVIDPSLTGKHLIHSKVTLHDGEENGVYDAVFTLSQDSIKVWGDFVVGVVFYESGILVKDGISNSHVKTNLLIPVPEETYDLWVALDVMKGTFSTWVKSEEMENPLLIYADAGFNHTDFSELNMWSTIHNPSGQKDSLTVSLFEITSNSDPSLASLSTNIGSFTTEFDSSVQEYEMTVPYGTTSLTLEAVPNGMGASVEMFDGLGEAISDDGVLTFNTDGIDVEIQVTALDGTFASYYLSVFVDDGTSEATLSGITSSIGALSPSFDKEIHEYSVVVPVGTQKVNITGLPTYPQAAVNGDGEITLTNGTATANINVISFDESENDSYTVNIVEADGLNYAIQLEGDNGNSSHIDISGLQLNTLPYTIEMWVKPDGVQTYNAGLIYNRASEGNAGIQYASSWQGSNMLRLMTNIEGDYGVTVSSVSNDVWHHVVAVVTASSRTIYLDGTAYTEAATNSPFDFSFGELFIGWDNGGENRAFKGSIDEVRVWNDSLDLQTLQDNRYSVLEGDETGLVGYWNFDLNNASQAYDWTGNGVNGLIKGGTIVESFPRANLNLETLSVDKGTLYPAITPGLTQYDLVLPVGTTSFTLSASPEDESASVDGTGLVTLDSDRGSASIVVSQGTSNMSYTINYIVESELTLKHSYTFADGTASDVVGNANGILNGGRIENGVYVADEDGEYISLPADSIAINTYASFTLEVYFVAGDGVNVANSMISWFGNTSSSNYGVDGIFLSHKSRTAISCGSYSAPWGAENGVNSIELEDGLPHYMVSTVTNDSISLFVDGIYIASSKLSDDNKIFNLSNEFAYLCKSGYTYDSSWKGSILEFNIYSGVMDEATVAQRSASYPVEDGAEDATLLNIDLDGSPFEGFASDVFEYTVEVESSDYEPLIAAQAKNENATVVVTQAPEIPGTATIVSTAADGETVLTYTIEFTLTSTSIEDVADKDAVMVYPTITKGDVTIRSNGEHGILTVYDMTGHVIINRQLQSSEEVINLQSNGLYLIRIVEGNDVSVFKVMKVN